MATNSTLDPANLSHDDVGGGGDHDDDTDHESDFDKTISRTIFRPYFPVKRPFFLVKSTSFSEA